MWDFLPVNLNEIKQIEVIRGPASAVWGANALYGVVNVITKSPREMQGTSAMLGVGGFDRPRTIRRSGARCATSAARTRRRSTIAGRVQAVGRRLLAGSLCAADRHRSRATGRRSAPVRPRRIRRTRTSGTTQPKFDARRRLRLSRRPGSCRSRAASPAPTASCTPGIGPFDIKSGTVMGYGKVNYTEEGASRAAFFTNILNGDANEPARARPDTASQSRSPSTRKPTTSRRRTCRRSAQARRQLRRQPAIQHLRPVDRAAG